MMMCLKRIDRGVVLRMYPYRYTHQVVYIKYTQRFAHQSSLNNAVLKNHRKNKETNMAHKDICFQAPCLYVVEPGTKAALLTSSLPLIRFWCGLNYPFSEGSQVHRVVRQI